MQVFLLALEASVYPTLLAAVVILLSQPRRVALLSVYLVGGLIMSIGIGLVIVFAVKGSGVAKTSQATLSWTLDLTVGGLALLVAVALATRADQRLRQRRQAKKPPKPVSDDREPWSQRVLARGSVPIVFFAGLTHQCPRCRVPGCAEGHRCGEPFDDPGDSPDCRVQPDHVCARRSAARRPDRGARAHRGSRRPVRPVAVPQRPEPRGADRCGTRHLPDCPRGHQLLARTQDLPLSSLQPTTQSLPRLPNLPNLPADLSAALAREGGRSVQPRSPGERLRPS